MLHTVNTLTIRRYGEIDRTENLSLLRRWWNVFPVRWFNVESLLLEIRKALGSDNDNLITDKIHQHIAYNNILMLNRIFKTMRILMTNQNDRSLFRLVFKKKPKTYDGNLKYYIEKVRNLTGIEIKDGTQLKQLEKEILRRIDKYNERYSNEDEAEKIDFIDLALSVFSIVGMDYVPEMTIAEFGRLKIKADNILKSQRNNARD